DIVDEGMWRVCEFGTARHYKVPNMSMCGKTGTVQNSRGKDHSIFVGYAPRENPQIAIAVVVENAGFGATWALPIASLMIEQYINGKIERTDLLERITTTTFSASATRKINKTNLTDSINGQDF
ncbi:MAG: penicillin-binding protein 2, partial [Bacteroidales bacterium]|nr:penicillin-binding protein 2 [Bacteroidales bacterium]